MRLNPKDPEALNNLGAVYYITEQHQKALVNFLKAANTKPDYATLITTWQCLLHVRQEYRSGNAQRAATKLRTDYFEARTNLGSLLITLGRNQEAITEPVKLSD